jgi:hypothetical protein
MATTYTPVFGAALTAASVSQFGSEFDAFLYASLNEPSDEPMLSVLSALARLDIDPWQEASKLARMSRDKAVWRMAALIETLTEKSTSHLNSKEIATRLVALLPRQIPIIVRAQKTTSIPGASINIRAVLALILLNALFVAFLFGNQYLTKTRPPATQPNQSHSSVVSKLSPVVPSLPVGE